MSHKPFSQDEAARFAKKWEITYDGAHLALRMFYNPNITDEQYANLFRLIARNYSTYDPFEPILTTKDGRRREML